VVAGLTVAAMLVPQAMAYAELGGLPPSAGFRAALVALPLYALIGTSRHLGVGPEPGTAVLAALTVAPLAAGDPDRYLALMAALAGIVGLFALLAGLLRLGFIAELLSKPVLVGYITGVGLTLLSSQLAKLFGADVTAGDFFPRFAQFFTRLDSVDSVTTGVGLGTLTVIMGLRRQRPTAPGALIGLLLATAAVSWFDLDTGTVGQIDAALPSPAVPDVGMSDLVSLLGPAAGLLLIAYTDNILTARSIATKQGYRIDPDRELIGLGAMNAAGAFGGGFPVSSSASRSIVPATLGSKSQLSALVSFVAVIVVLVAGRGLLAEIPQAALAAVIVAAAFAVIDVEGFRHLLRVSPIEAGLAGVTCLAILTVDLLFGVLVAVVLSGLLMLHRVARPHDAILGQGEGLDGWIDVRDLRARTEPGLLVYRFDAPLFFANADEYAKRVLEALEENPSDETHAILDFEGIGSIDSTAAERLQQMHDELTDLGLSISVARANDEAIDVMRRCGLVDLIGSEHIHPTINAAVAEFRRRR
jgi:high affinity sulfate transporter 1